MFRNSSARRPSGARPRLQRGGRPGTLRVISKTREASRSGAAAADAVIHTAFNHDFSKYVANCEADRQAIVALGSVRAGSERFLVVTSGTGSHHQGRRGFPLPLIPFLSEDPDRAGAEGFRDRRCGTGDRGKRQHSGSGCDRTNQKCGARAPSDLQDGIGIRGDHDS